MDAVEDIDTRFKTKSIYIIIVYAPNRVKNWIYKRKGGVYRRLESFKARMIAKDFTQ